MAFCSNCNAELEEGCAFCTNCGTPLAPAPQAEVYQPETYQPETYQPEVYQAPDNVEVAAPAAENDLPKGAKIMSIISMACGIASIPLCCFGGTMLGIAAIVLAILAKKQTPPGVKNTMAQVGMITGIAGVALGVIASIVSFCIGFIGGMSGYSYY